MAQRMAKNLTAFCSCSKNLSEVEVKSNGLAFLLENFKAASCGMLINRHANPGLH